MYLYLGIFSVKLEPSSRLNRTFLFICIFFAIWAFSFAVMFSSASRPDIQWWYNISSVGWCLFSGAAIHFLLILSGRGAPLRRWWIYFPLYGPGLILIYKQWSDSFAAVDFLRVGYGLIEIPPIHTGWYRFFMAYQSGYIIIGLVALIIWGINSKIRREKKQALMIFATSSISLILSFTNDILLPALGVYFLPSLSPIIILIWAFGMWFSITKYKLMSLNLAAASNEIISTMKDMLILVDLRGAIVKINPRITALLGYDEKNILNRSIGFLVLDGAELEKIFSAMTGDGVPGYELTREFISLSGCVIPVKMTATVLRDRFGDPIGTIFVCSDISETIQLQNEIRERIKTGTELLLRNEIIEADLLKAQIIQKALLPARPPCSERLAVDFRNYAMNKVGGDYFSFTPLGADELGVFIGDFSGHGVSAALFLSLLKSVSERVCRSYGRQPVDFIRELNRELLDNMMYFFITALYGYFSFPGGDGSAVFTFSKGGHPDPLIFRAGTGDVNFLECPGTILGQFPSIRLNEISVEMKKGDRIFLYTDGLPETRNSENDFFRFSNLIPLFRRSTAGTLSGTLDAIVTEIDAFRGPVKPEDDIVIIGIEVMQ